MGNIKKIAVFLALLAFLSVCSFAETYYSFSTGLFRSYGQFFDDNYGRELDGINISSGINYYPAGSSLGWFVSGSAGAVISGFEWTENDISLMSNYSTTDLRLSGGPSYKVVSGSNIVVPISLGPVFSNYREESYIYDDYYEGEDYYYGGGDMLFYEAINIGLLADAAILITPFKWLALRVGLSAAWDFVRFERGNLQMNNRKANGGQFKYVNFGALNLCVYSGIGIRF